MSLPGPGFTFFQDNLESQLPPRSAWGREYIGIKFRPRTDEKDIYRVVADKDGTTVEITGDHQDVFVLNEGQHADFQTAGNFKATSNEAFAVGHYISSAGQSMGKYDAEEYPGGFQGGADNCPNPEGLWANNVGDPAASYLVPTDQLRSRYTFLVPETFAWDMVSIWAKAGDWDSIELDGEPLPASTPTGLDDWVYASFLVDDGSHYVASDLASFGLEVYGYDCRVSYAYPGGLSVRGINTPPPPS